MDPLDHSILAMAASWTEEDAARQREHMECIAAYLRAFGAAFQLSVPTSEPAVILIAAAQILDCCKELTDPAIARSLAVSEARRGMAVLDAKTEAAAQQEPLFTRSHWNILRLLAHGALTVVRKDESRRALLKVVKLAARKANVVARKQPAKSHTLVVVGDNLGDTD